jgi:hypothetical protein
MTKRDRDVGMALQDAGSAVTRTLQERPYVAIGLAMGLGYLAGGGLFSHWTRPLARVAMGLLLVPRIRDRLSHFLGDGLDVQPLGAA